MAPMPAAFASQTERFNAFAGTYGYGFRYAG